MAIFLDTGEIEEVENYMNMGILRGVTTNPTVLLKSGVTGGKKAIKKRSIEIAINGMEGEITVNGAQYSGMMEKLDLTDEEIASVMTFLRTNLGNSGDPVTVEEVKRVRKKIESR